jgi:hypothetical protein
MGSRKPELSCELHLNRQAKTHFMRQAGIQDGLIRIEAREVRNWEGEKNLPKQQNHFQRL